MANFNFLNPEVLTDAVRTRLDAQGEQSVLRKIKNAHRRPLTDDPWALAKGMPASRVQNPNADDAIDQDEDDMDTDADDDLDMVLTDTERADLRTRRKA